MEHLLFASAGIPFYILDSCFTYLNIQSPYYFMHVLHNLLVIYLAYPDVLSTFTDFHNLHTYSLNPNLPILVTSFHMYHIVKYRKTLRYDDLLHHGLMIGVAIPLGVLATRTTTLMSYSLFWATGLPGAITYFSLFLQRNGILTRIQEKAINTWINLWIRSPGCVSLLALSLVYYGSSQEHLHLIGLFPSILMYWNGQYFMNQAVIDYTMRFSKVTTEEV
jgi:hypothetical protein